MNKVWDLGFGFASRSSGGAYKKRGQVGFRRVDRARGLMWGSGVVLNDSWYVSGNLYLNFTVRLQMV